MRYERTRLWATSFSVAIFALGIVFLWTSSNISSQRWSSFFANIGGVAIASVALTVMADVILKPKLIDELFYHSEVSQQLKGTRLLGISNSFFAETIPWKELFERSHKVHIMFTYGRAWREKNGEYLHDFLAKPDSRLWVLLPDQDNHDTMNVLQCQREEDGGDVRARIGSATKYFEALSNKFPGKVEIYFMCRVQSLAIYMFDQELVFTLQSNRPGRRSVPTFRVERGGELYEFFQEEINGIIEAEATKTYVRKMA